MNPDSGMSRANQWPIRRPRRVGLFAWALALAALFSLAYVSLYTIPVALYFLWRFRFHPQWGLACPAGVLIINDKGEWGLSMGESFLRLSLARAWQGMGWVTLRFTEAGTGRAGPELTVWRAGTPAPAWRRLCVLAAGGPVAAAHRGAA